MRSRRFWQAELPLRAWIEARRETSLDADAFERTAIRGFHNDDLFPAIGRWLPALAED